VQTYWTNFARTGNSNGTGAPRQPFYSAKGGWPVRTSTPPRPHGRMTFALVTSCSPANGSG
jgi:hypothetical protein